MFTKREINTKAQKVGLKSNGIVTLVNRSILSATQSHRLSAQTRTDRVARVGCDDFLIESDQYVKF